MDKGASVPDQATQATPPFGEYPSRIGDLPERLFAQSLSELIVEGEEQEPSAFFYSVQDAAALLAEIRNSRGGNERMSPDPYAAYVAGWQAHRFCAHQMTVEQCWAIDRKHLASAIEAAAAGETPQSGSTVGESAVGTAETPNPSPSSQPLKV